MAMSLKALQNMDIGGSGELTVPSSFVKKIDSFSSSSKPFNLSVHLNVGQYFICSLRRILIIENRSNNLLVQLKFKKTHSMEGFYQFFLFLLMFNVTFNLIFFFLFIYKVYYFVT